jgi:hypothetical protein
MLGEGKAIPEVAKELEISENTRTRSTAGAQSRAG